jgi:ankyrin repeat protein
MGRASCCTLAWLAIAHAGVAYAQFDAYPVSDHETVIQDWNVPAQWSGPDRHYTLTLFGRRWAFLDGWDAGRKRIWRSQPMPLVTCMTPGKPGDQVTISGFGKDGVYLLVKGCERSPGAYLRTPDGGMISFEPVVQAGTFLLSLPPGQTQALDYDRYVEEGWRVSPPTDVVGTPLPVPQNVEVTATDTIGPADLLAAIEQARSTLKGAHANYEKGRNDLFPAILYTDWRQANLSPDDENDLGYILARGGKSLPQSQACDDSMDGALIIEDVLRHDPKRAVAHLNLADEYQWQAKHCTQGPTDSLHLRALEQYREYCNGIGPASVPPVTAGRVAAALGVPRLDDKACSPSYAALDAVEDRNLPALKKALADGCANPSAIGPDGVTALYVALNAHLSEYARALIAGGADPNLSGQSDSLERSLELAIWNYDAPTVATLVKAGGHVDQPLHARGTSRYPALFQAAELGATTPGEERVKLAMLTAMLAQKPNVDARDPYGGTPLMAAAMTEDPDAVNLLLMAGAKPDAVDDDKGSALMRIQEDSMRSVAVARALIAAGAPVNQQGDQGRTALLVALCYLRNDKAAVVSVTRVLLDAGANPSQADDDGNTPLECAVKTDNLAAMKLVLEHGGRASPRHAGTAISIIRDKQVAQAAWAHDSDAGHKQQWDDWVKMEELLSAQKP